MSLLMCFFVILYATAEIDPEKSKEITDQLKGFFSDNQDVIDQQKMNESQTLFLLLSILNKEIKEEQGEDLGLASKEAEEAETVDDISEKLKDRILDRLERAAKKIVVYDFILPDDELFSSGSTRLRKASQKKVNDIAKVIRSVKNIEGIAITGHSDGTPTSRNSRYPNNFALSSARAGTIAQLFIDNGVDKSTIKVSGMGPLEPLFPEKDSRGKLIRKNQQRNRRVHIMLKVRKNR